MSFPINLDGISVGAGWEHPDFVGAKHSGSKSLVLTNNLSAGMLRPYGYICKIGMLPAGSLGYILEARNPDNPPRPNIH